MDVPLAEARRRLEANRLNPGRSDVRDADFRLVAERVEPLGDDEAAIRFDGRAPPDAWLARMGLRTGDG